MVTGCGLTGLDDLAANTLSCMIRVYEECPDLPRVPGRIQQGVRLILMLIAALQCISLAPATTTYHDILFLKYIIGPVHDELGVDAENIANGAFYLTGSIVCRAQSTNRQGNELLQFRDVLKSGQSDHSSR